ncbi:hypothetical protein HY641_04010 [Candidatus Woesearchaeota archaeon]|nr:hypothetical protein [Candidatus Woesearchaeota archaeon]
MGRGMERRAQLSMSLYELAALVVAAGLLILLLTKGAEFLGIFYGEEGQSSLANLRTLGVTVGELLLDPDPVEAKMIPYFLDPTRAVIAFSKGKPDVKGTCGIERTIVRPTTCPLDASCLCLYEYDASASSLSDAFTDPTCLPPFKTIDIIHSPAYQHGTAAGLVSTEQTYANNFIGNPDLDLFPHNAGGYFLASASTILVGYCQPSIVLDDPQGPHIVRADAPFATRPLYVEKTHIKDNTYILVGIDRTQERERLKDLRVLYQLDIPDYETFLAHKQYETLFENANRFFELRKDENENVAAVHIILARALSQIATQPGPVILDLYPKIGKLSPASLERDNLAALAMENALYELKDVYEYGSPVQQSTALLLALDIIAKTPRRPETPAVQRIKIHEAELQKRIGNLKGGSEAADYLLATFSFDKKQWKDATTRLSAFVSAYPRSKHRTDAHFRLGHARSMIGNHLGAIEAFGVVAREAPTATLRLDEEILQIIDITERTCDTHVLEDDVFLACHSLAKDQRISKESIQCPTPRTVPLSDVTCIADRCEATSDLIGALAKAKNEAAALGDLMHANANAYKLLVTEALHSYNREDQSFRAGRGELGTQPTCTNGHVAGMAVDVVLKGKDLETGGEETRNQALLRSIMCKAGFLTYDEAPTHFEYSTPAWQRAGGKVC